MSRRGEQLLTTFLATVCAVLFVLALLFQFGVGAGYSWESAESDEVIVREVTRELQEIAGFTAGPRFTRIFIHAPYTMDASASPTNHAYV